MMCFFYTVFECPKEQEPFYFGPLFLSVIGQVSFAESSRPTYQNIVNKPSQYILELLRIWGSSQICFQVDQIFAIAAPEQPASIQRFSSVAVLKEVYF